MRAAILTICLLSCCLGVLASDVTDSLLSQLKTEIGRKAVYDHQKEKRIAGMRDSLQRLSADSTAQQFQLCSRLYEEYKSYKYDSAYVYVSRMAALANRMHDALKVNYTNMKLGFILLSAGKYKEAFGVLETIDHSGFDDATLESYYAVMSRAWCDLATYNNDDTWSPAYRAKGLSYSDSSLRLVHPGSYGARFLVSYRDYNNGNNASALKEFLAFYQQYKPANHDDAITTSLLSDLYQRLGDNENATNYLIRAVIADLQASTKETLAIFKLAEMASANGDVDNAYIYIQEALKDADFYGARQRQIQISTVLPIIAAAKLNFVESQKKRFLIYLSSTIFLLLVIILISFLLYKQLKQRAAREKLIQRNNTKLAAMNEELMQVNAQVVEANHRFAEDAHIKEEYIGYFFNIISGYITKLEKLKVSIEAKVIQNKLDHIQSLTNEIQVNKEREALFQTFDKVFLKIFPNFVTSFNALFKKEDQLWPKDHEILTTDLRIFALIRLGISDNESIARILQYSAKTVYVYKMRQKAKSIYTATEFDQKLMAIKAIDIPVRVQEHGAEQEV
ncbi:hypothetical protein A4D02_28755 [Niastella koreensis]|uniref:DUF6377 domain-containing protein n=2 Tax=Niastella koreensis TaxID=354356 RepID=G8T784_NIAKG|nr:DUF6377 domain-containing protein [Niastella koreensis]AEW00109.1 hypothetical protein Niako_3815 [Niastella koreensis GR20-10]OQP49583.1 hypothetical protein A4D02_28755 [Niastella koreensis]